MRAISDVAWKHGIQLVLAASFVGAFWLLLLLRAELFRMIGIRALFDFMHRPWFAGPATIVALTYAIRATDARAELVRGVRTLTLTLLAWLLPMMLALPLPFWRRFHSPGCNRFGICAPRPPLCS
jgi:hypothetical protein